MYIISLDQTEAINITPKELAGKAHCTIRWLLSKKQGTPTFDMRYIALSGPAYTEWHTHPWEHEVFVVRGNGKLRCGDKEVNIKPNDVIYVEPGVYHQFVCLGDSLEFICVIPISGRPDTL